MRSDPSTKVEGWLPAWLPDETLYSWCSRYHQACGNALARVTCAQLFGAAGRGSAHDFPAGIDGFVHRTDGALGNALAVIGERTVLPFYLPWHDAQTQNRAVATLRGPRCGALKFRLGLLTSRFGANHPLRACEVCRREDAQRYGTPYWHRIHQCPGIYVCTRHGTALRTARVKSNGVGRFLFFLPEDRHLAPAPRIESMALTALVRLARCASMVLDAPPSTQFEPARLAMAYVARARELGLTRGDRSLALTPLAHAYAAATAPLACVDALVPALGDAETIRDRVARLFRAPRGRTHPLRHLVLITCLFPDWSDFMRVYHAEQRMDSRPQKHARTAGARDETRERFLREVLRRGASLTAAAASTGIAVATAQDWATRAGVRVPIRPKRLRPNLRNRVVAALKRGQEQAVIAETLQIAPSLVRAVLRTELGLRDEWHDAQLRARREHWRRALRMLRLRHPRWQRKELRGCFQAGYAWLRRHDRSWLERALPKPTTRGGGGNNSRTDWHRRDRVLREAILLWASAARPGGKRKRVLPWQVCQAVPALRTQRGNLSRLPLTSAVVRSLCAH